MPHYPEGTVRALLESDHVTPATRTALESRLAAPAHYEAQFFDADTYALLRAVAARLFPQPDRAEPIELAPAIDQRLLAGRADGWRYDAMPPDREAYRLGLGGINQTAEALFHQSFVSLPAADQDAVVQALADGQAQSTNWAEVSQKYFFEELLAELTELYYAHPLAQEEIGYVGMADQPGWQRLGLNEREDREPPEQLSNGVAE
ncbi:gluconate 2-dehydrogenase subunit 3 family protein [Hymenobacter psychrotolerans]|uniref:Gluconate 2-dehydrogenase subunit 3 n=1 Tax=Hymenobacter psychrotolerans DSM 18569 TaxID=1121959 RepID=A0A1M7FT31_9BACT|nr:gluconate 2-dehydrogenase subunit 3 family protein [Hymenobacter psychrotolerans]SHM06829.1 Gluconate 2-dehydrogenase subunit 3 [Hymenobacter psychrotolerans DSM 18569]